MNADPIIEKFLADICTAFPEICPRMERYDDYMTMDKMQAFAEATTEVFRRGAKETGVPIGIVTGFDSGDLFHLGTLQSDGFKATDGPMICALIICGRRAHHPLASRARRHPHPCRRRRFAMDVQEYKANKKKRLGEEGARPERIRYKPVSRGIT
jgi:hypothetical protein